MNMDEASALLNQYAGELAHVRLKLIKILVVFAIGAVFGFLFNQQILIFCIKSFNFHGVNIIVTSPGQLIELSFYTSLMSGLLFAAPVLIHEILHYVRPALADTEYKILKAYAPISGVLFLLGGAFGLWITQMILVIFAKLTTNFQVSNIWDIQKFFNQVIMTSFLTGLIFQLPLILTILIRFGLLTRGYLISQRATVYSVLLIVAMLLPPTDILSLFLLTAPLLALFEITLLLNFNKP